VANINQMNRQWKSGLAPVHWLPARAALTKAELAEAFWRAVSALRRSRLKNIHTLTLLAHIEREFQAAWDDPPRRNRVFELHS
jgi:hypothetical protein